MVERSERRDYGKPRQRLGGAHLVSPGYRGRWVSDRKGGVEDALEDGYDFVKADRAGKPGAAPRGRQGGVHRRGGVNEDGASFDMFLMQIEQKRYDALYAEQQRENDDLDEELYRNAPKPGFYAPNGGMKRETNVA